MKAGDEAEVYLIRTNNSDDAATIIKRVQPHVIVTIESDSTLNRRHSKIFFDEKAIAAGKYNYAFLRRACDQFGFEDGMIYFVTTFAEAFVDRLLNINHLSSLSAVRKILNDNKSYRTIILGDRPITLTVRRRMTFTLTNIQKSYLLLCVGLSILFGLKCMCLKAALALRKYSRFRLIFSYERRLDIQLIVYALQEATKIIKFNQPIRVVAILDESCSIADIVELWERV